MFITFALSLFSLPFNVNNQHEVPEYTSKCSASESGLDDASASEGEDNYAPLFKSKAKKAKTSVGSTSSSSASTDDSKNVADILDLSETALKKTAKDELVCYIITLRAQIKKGGKVELTEEQMENKVEVGARPPL